MNRLHQLLDAHSSAESRLTVRSFVEQTEEVREEYVLIEGKPESLRFLAELIMAFVESDASGCNFDMHPKGAGSAHFSDDSSVGIYLHRLPCELHSDWVVR